MTDGPPARDRGDGRPRRRHAARPPASTAPSPIDSWLGYLADRLAAELLDAQEHAEDEDRAEGREDAHES